MKKLISLVVRFIPRKYLQRVAGAGLKVLALFSRGSRVTCPICERSYNEFFPYGRLKPRPNALCPGCMSLERHRAIWLYLREKTDFFKTRLSVLHVAPQACFIKHFERQHSDRYITADIESPLAKVRMDVHNIPFAVNTFDMVICNHVLEHVDNDILAMREIARVLKPGGLAILLVPFFNPIPEVTVEDLTVKDPRERERLFGQDDHVRKFGRDYTQRIQLAGLTPIADTFVVEMGEQTRYRYGLSPAEVIYGGRKPH